MTSSRSESAGSAAPPRGRRDVVRWLTVAVFLLPAFVVIGALLAYPIVYTFVRSLYGSVGSDFVGLGNYRDIFTEPRTLIAVRNNLIWVVIAPAIVTSLGLVFAVLADRIRWAPVFRMALFMPLVVSGLAAGVTFRFLYAADPDVGLVNAAIRSVVHLVQPPGPYPGARPSQPDLVDIDEGAILSTAELAAGDAAAVGLVGIPPFALPAGAAEAAAPAAAAGAVAGTVWLDFSPGGEAGRVDPGERGLPGVRLELLRGDRVVGEAISGPDGSFAFPDVDAGGGPYRLRLEARNFRAPWGGIPWLGPLLIVPAIIVGYVWIQTGFAVIIIGAGLTGIDPDLQSAARVEGADEWQVFRHITVPLLRPVLLVVFVTTIISVLKIFDLVLVIAPESVQYDANVLALEMWRASFGGARDFGLGSALAALLFLMIIPAMVFNLRRFRMEGP